MARRTRAAVLLLAAAMGLTGGGAARAASLGVQAAADVQTRDAQARDAEAVPGDVPAIPRVSPQARDAHDADGDRWQVWINPGLYSRHFERDRGLRENNTGLGAEVFVTREHGLLTGGYHNSNDAWTRYLGYQWRPLWWGEPRGWQAGLGVIVAAFDGYPEMRGGGWFIAALPVLAIEYRRIGVNLTVVPGYKDRLHGALAMQVRLRVW